MSEDQIPRIITRLYALVDELEELFPGRKFTPDGHLVGSIGEVVAKYFYDLSLSRHSEAFDGETNDGTRRKVQIKLTAGKSVSLAVQPTDPELLLVLHINRTLGFEEIYNGSYPVGILRGRKVSRRQVKNVSLLQLKQAQADRALQDEGRIEKLNAHFRKGT